VNGRQRAEFTERYGVCPIEAGVAGNLADHECPHGRLASDLTPDCGCFAPRRPQAVDLGDVLELLTGVAPLNEYALEKTSFPQVLDLLATANPLAR
jgi:hypothetical protein